MLLKELREGGMLPLKELSLILRISKLVQLPRLLGISPENLFLETSRIMRVIKLPSCEGKGPLRRLLDTSRKIDRVVEEKYQ